MRDSAIFRKMMTWKIGLSVFFCVECRLFCPAERNFMSERQNPSHERIRTRQRTTVFRLGNSQYLEDEKVQNPEAKMIVPGN